MPQTVTVSAGDRAYKIFANSDGSGSGSVATPLDNSIVNVSVTFTPAGLPMDVLKSMQEEKRPWGEDGCHFNEDGFCATHFTQDDAGKPYGDVQYADPGYQGDGKHRYPIDRASHVRAAWAYINMVKNAAKYNAEQLGMIKDRIKAAAKRLGVEIMDREQDSEEMSAQSRQSATLLAGAAPLAPPAQWFVDPSLPGPTRLTISEDGHVFGHLAQWRVCHVGIGNSCVIAPKSKTNYGLFRVGTLVCDDGSQVPIGKITLGTGHANAQWGVMPSREHYDNTGWAAAVVNAGEDKHGIWVNGALTSTMTPEKVAEFRAAALSGDWRVVDGNLELIAALAVNSPGFPIYRETAGRAFSLIAVGVLGADDNVSGEFSVDTADEAQAVVEADQAPGTEEVSDERMQKLAAITESWDQEKREQRLAQLAVLDKARDENPSPKPLSARSKFRFDQVYDAKYTVQDEDEE